MDLFWKQVFSYKVFGLLESRRSILVNEILYPSSWNTETFSLILVTTPIQIVHFITNIFKESDQNDNFQEHVIIVPSFCYITWNIGCLKWFISAASVD